MRDSSESAHALARAEGEPLHGSAVDALSFERLYTSYFAFTWRVLGHLGVPSHHLDDAVQEVWLTVHRRLPTFEGRSALKTWLFGVALNVARNQHRAEQRHTSRRPPAELAPTSHDPETLHAARDAWERVERFASTLDEQRRAIFVCHLLEQLSATETAEAVGVDVNTVYKRVRSLRHSFKVWLLREREGEEGKT